MLNTLLNTHKIKVDKYKAGADHLYVTGQLNDEPIDIACALTSKFIVVNEASEKVENLFGQKVSKEYSVNPDSSLYKLICRIKTKTNLCLRRFEHPVLRHSLDNSTEILEQFASECLETFLKSYYVLYSTKHPVS